MSKTVKTRIKKQYSFPLYLVLWIVCTFVGLLEAGLIGAVTGLVVALFCSLITLTGIIPFVGIFLYWSIGHWFIGYLATLGASAPIASAIAFWVFFVLTLISWAFISFVVGVLLLALIFGRR